jgi:hypothetical protein
MNDEVTIKSSIMANEKQTFNFSKELDGVTKTVRGEECENGWVITITKEWCEGESPNKQWKSESKKYISKDNPLEKIEKNKDKKEGNDISEMIDGFNSLSGMLSVG